MAGKGSRPRPYSVSLKEFDSSYDNIFGKKETKERWVPPPPIVIKETPRQPVTFIQEEKK
jgi:hypothetical protein